VGLSIAAYLETEKGRYEKLTEMEATKSHYLINVEKKIVSVYLWIGNERWDIRAVQITENSAHYQWWA